TLIVGENRMTGKILYLSRFHAKPVPTAWSEDAGYQRRIVWLAEIFAGRGSARASRRSHRAMLYHFEGGDRLQQRPASDVSCPTGPGRAFRVGVES
ncbi:MAG TPA: hypothetical protein VK979_09360, partial [Guyparkeria sp.]|nr:hypothetical protein [Guyparkeria sp.]